MRRGPVEEEIVFQFEVGVLVRHLCRVEDLLEVLHEGLHHACRLGVLGTVVGDVGHSLFRDIAGLDGCLSH